MLAQIFFFAQDLTVKKPCGRAQINQTYPIWEDEEFSYQDNREGHVNGIATQSKTPSVMSLSGWSASMPTRKLCRKEIRLHKNSNSPAKQNSTPIREIISEWKNWCVVIAGQWKAAANRA